MSVCSSLDSTGNASPLTECSPTIDVGYPFDTYPADDDFAATEMPCAVGASTAGFVFDFEPSRAVVFATDAYQQQYCTEQHCRLPIQAGPSSWTTGTKKERRRTHNINRAFADLRQCIPNVPKDTKLSKIKTLRLATSYIQHLMLCLRESDAQRPTLPRPMPTVDLAGAVGHHPAATAALSRTLKRHIALGCPVCTEESHHNRSSAAADKTLPKRRRWNDTTRQASKRIRTGWPQHVWALELPPCLTE